MSIIKQKNTSLWDFRFLYFTLKMHLVYSATLSLCITAHPVSPGLSKPEKNSTWTPATVKVSVRNSISGAGG